MDNKKNIFLKKAFLRFFVPSVLSSVALAIGAFADCFFVGSQIGAEGLTVIGFGAPIYAFFSLISIGVSTGASIHYAVAVSEGNVASGQEIFRNTLLFVFITVSLLSLAGLALTPAALRLLGVREGAAIYPLAREYITVMLCSIPVMFMQAPFYFFVNSDSAPKLAAVALVSANIADVLLNYLFIVVLQVGIVGSVYSTLLGAVVTIALCQLHVFSKKTVLSYGNFHVRFGHIVRAAITGFATNARYAYQFVVLLVFNHLMVETWGENGVACLNVAMSIATLVLAVMEGVGLTLEPMIATFYGERNKENIIVALRYALTFGGLASAALLLLISGGAPYYCPLFGLDTAELVSGSVRAIRVYMLSMPAAFVLSVLTYYYQTIGRENISYGLTFLSEAAGVLGFGILLARTGGFDAFWWCYLAANTLTLVLFGGYCLMKRSLLFLNFREAVFTAFIRSTASEISAVTEDTRNFCETQGASVRQAYFVMAVIEEISSAIFMRQTQRDAYIQLTLVKETDKDFVLHLRDDNQEDFSPFDTDTSRPEKEREGENAIGMKLVKHYAKSYFYRKYSGFNTLVVTI